MIYIYEDKTTCMYLIISEKRFIWGMSLLYAIPRFIHNYKNNTLQSIKDNINSSDIQNYLSYVENKEKAQLNLINSFNTLEKLKQEYPEYLI